MNDTQRRIEDAVRPLIGLPWLAAGRAADMQTFQLGPLQTQEGRYGVGLVGRYSLHVQCAWRLVGPAGIIVASRDRYYPAGDPYQEPPDWDWSKLGTNRCDQRIARFLAERADIPLIVEGISADPVGGLRLHLSGGHRLDLFPDDSLEGEHWRLIQRQGEREHFVVTGADIEGE